MTERLTTLAAVKDWLEIENDSSDEQLIRLIDAASQFVLGWLNRTSFQVQTYTQNFRGNGHTTMLLANWPVVSVTSVGIGGVVVPAASLGTGGLPSSGYVVSDARKTNQSLDLYGGYGFTRGAPSQIVYTAGFTHTEQATLPAAVDSLVTYSPASHVWSKDRGVVIAGVELQPTDSTSPDSGEYHVDLWGKYTLNEDTAGLEASISYDYVPADVSFAVTELIGEWYKRKDRIGVLSKTLGGQETITYSQRDMNDSIRSSLQIYKNVVPI